MTDKQSSSYPGWCQQHEVINEHIPWLHFQLAVDRAMIQFHSRTRDFWVFTCSVDQLWKTQTVVIARRHAQLHRS